MTAISFKISLTHELCYLPETVIKMGLPCAWNTPRDSNTSLKHIFMVREPLSRALSIYYFWGELFKFKRDRSEAQTKKKKFEGRLGSETELTLKEIKGNFLYHGNESSVPPLGTALKFAKDLPYHFGMPGQRVF
jgi:hypothetical protein